MKSAGARGFVSALFLTFIAVVANVAAWQWANPAHVFPNWHGKVTGVAYAGFRIGQDPTKDRYPTEDELREDMKLLAQHAYRIRTYTSIENEAVPRLAAEQGLRVTAGAWLDRREENNRLEIAMVIAEARANRGVDRVMIGNETVLRDDLKPEQLIRHIKYVKSRVRVPVSTAEPWHVWLRYPELARTVDFITVHLLPYWEGVPADQAVDYVIDRLDELQAAYPRKRIVIGEVGWPSLGDRRGAAVASVENQAQFVRAFLSRVGSRGIEYYFMEAFDQPWKAQHEGRAGGYWGLFNADRTEKFPLAGPVFQDPQWAAKAGVSALLAAPLMLWFALRFRRFRLAGKLVFCGLIQAAMALGVWLVCLPFEAYLGTLDWIMLGLLLPSLVAMISILLANGFEFTEVLWNRGWQRRHTVLPALPANEEPFVSIHVPTHNEPPEMVIATLESLARLAYGRYEVMVIDNNTKDPSRWAPVEAWCREAGEHFRFFHLDNWPGFKAGALNFALRECDPRTEVVAVVDADYVVDPGWLRSLVPHFAQSPNVAVVQAPQAHRDFQHSWFQRMCNWEFEGFFKIGMHHRNERNAIIQHGTMTLVRATALRTTGGWAEWCICEDAELGLRLMHSGYETRYVDTVMGRGLTPADFKSFKTQRMRWAFGAMQILKNRWSWLTRRGPLDAGQRYHFLTGWFSWFADALHFVFTMGSIVWTIGMLAFPRYITVPLPLFLVPVLGFFVCKAVFGPTLYRARVDCSWTDVIGASLASMGLSHAIARGVFSGLIQKKGTFVRTQKGMGGDGWLAAIAPVREELLMTLALGLAIVGVMTRLGGHLYEMHLWVTVLAAQSIPYVSSVVCSFIAARDAERARRAEKSAPTQGAPNVIPFPSPTPGGAYRPLAIRAAGGGEQR